MQRQLYRAVALERLSSPEQLDQLMQVTTLKGWLSLVALGALLLAALLWGVLGRVPTQVSGQGIFIRGSGVKTVGAIAPGQVQSVAVSAGEVVAEGQVVATIAPLEGGVPAPEGRPPLVVASPQSGRILEVLVDRGSVVERATPLVSFEPVADPLEVVVYLPAADGRKVRPGMAAQIEPATAGRGQFGFIRGTVRAVADFPSTYAGVMRVLQNDRLAQAFLVSGAPIEVRIAPAPDAASPSGFQWSASPGPPFPIGSGTLANVVVNVREQRPITFVVPVFDE